MSRGSSAASVRVLHISLGDGRGGSARSSYRVHDGLRRAGVWSRMLVHRKKTPDPDVSLISNGAILTSLDNWSGRAFDLLGMEYLFYPSTFTLPARRWFRESNIVQLYNIHGGYFSFMALPLLSQRRPLVWRLSDMWAFTGHVSHSFDCERWKLGCGECPSYLDPPYPLRRDTTATLWKLKKWAYSRTNLTIVTPSQWLATLARQSPLLGERAIHVIPNGLDTSVFRPLASEFARRALGLDPNKRYVLFCAHDTSQPLKGGKELAEALTYILRDIAEDVCLLTLGSKPTWLAPAGLPSHHLGYSHDDHHIALAYSAADIVVVPSLAENLPNSLLEGMACGRPVVAFDAGGISEALRHNETGYLAKRGDVVDLGQGIQRLLRDDPLRLTLGAQARRLIEQEHSLELQASRFLKLYNELLRNKPAPVSSEEPAQSWIFSDAQP